jgi:CHAT domain-containing protein
MAIPDALRAAQQAMQAKYEHPFFGAGFVLVE